jgi:nicotinate phosphoribosyltransferase
MGIPNETVMENEKQEQQRKEREAKERAAKAKERERLERSLEEGLRDTFPASDPISVTQPPRQN